MKTALLFPGQGSQKVDMLKNMPREKIILETIKEASEILEGDVYSLDTEEALKNTRNVQLSLFIYGVAMGRFLKENNVKFDIVIGHSIGAFTAAVMAESLDFKDGLRLVDLRGKLMAEGFPKGYGIGAIIGLNESILTSLVEKLRKEDEEVYIATINTKNQITVAGKLSAIEKLFVLAKNIGVNKTKILNVSVPSHCELLESISHKLKEEMKGVEFNKPKNIFVGNCRARALWNGDSIREDLFLGVSNTVKFYDGFVNAYERGVRTFIECGTGDVLSNMIKGEFNNVKVMSTGRLDLESIVYLGTNRN